MGDLSLNKDGTNQRRNRENEDSWHCLDSHRHGRSKRYLLFDSLSSNLHHAESICKLHKGVVEIKLSLGSQKLLSRFLVHQVFGSTRKI